MSKEEVAVGRPGGLYYFYELITIWNLGLNLYSQKLEVSTLIIYPVLGISPISQIKKAEYAYIHVHIDIHTYIYTHT